MRIGQVDLDTSHAQAFANLLVSRHGARITAVLDGGAVMTGQQVEEYARRYDATVYHSPEEMMGAVDLVLIQSVDWDRHRERAAPFIEAGIPVFIDKPLAGNLDDCRWFVEQEKNGARIYGCSSIPYSHELAAYLERAGDEPIQVVYTTIGTDDFNYAIHAAESLVALCGCGFDRVRWLGDAGSRELYQANHTSGAVALWHHSGPWAAYGFTVTKQSGVRSIPVAASEELYDALILRLLQAVQGQRPFGSIQGPAEAVKLLLAARRSRTLLGGWAALDSPALEGERFDGAAFTDAYAPARREQLAR